ncbi:hypothetical protein NEOLEDRAFT_1079348 [Neolentinus lepideus HHB14362 ss-1]|uniref:RNase H type-1 domain-containing protein n=1 Tax=Neolentinus lepideus HHB14362 ss-1 TaxID=1314782 RepID=A0A165MTS3_9AGAM|nr:hypothetical protein NEOLEDRAFT_1079348 [Neolentinus lepideus HHB14362 ss-1]
MKSLIPPFIPITFITDSRYVIDGLTLHLGTWEDQGWLGVANSRFFKAAAYQLRRRSAATSFLWVKGHSGDAGNEAADALACEGAAKDVPDIVDLDVPSTFNLCGAKLSVLTQAVAYRGIRLSKPNRAGPRTRALLNLSRMQDGINEITNTIETHSRLWLSCQSKNMRPLVPQFMFKAVQNAYKIGDFWLPIPGYETRAICPTCEDCSDNLDHILTECETPARALIWELAADLWPAAYGPFPQLTFGAIIGAGSLTAHRQTSNDDDTVSDDEHNIGDSPTRPHRGGTRLLQILVSESSYLLWVLRCERVIQNRVHSIRTITARWTNTINRRLSIDRIVAGKIRRSPKAVTQVAQTWKDTLANI